MKCKLHAKNKMPILKHFALVNVLTIYFRKFTELTDGLEGNRT